MSPIVLFFVLISYFLLLWIVSRLTCRNDSNATFYLASRKSPWYLVAIGMLGASISGVTFISVPGWVISGNFSYLQMVFGFVAGYFIIAYVLLPIYYRLEVTSIYSYFEERFNISAYKTGAWLFLISRTIGSAFRLYIVSLVLQTAIFTPLGIPLWLTVILTISLIWLYSHRGGIGTIIYTDVLQTFFLIAAALITLYEISEAMGLDWSGTINTIARSHYSKVFYFNDWRASNHFVKYFLSGVFITIVMTGLDQDMMQKNLSCRSLKDAQKNMITYGLMFIPINLLFLSLGALLVIYSQWKGIPLPAKTDDLYPSLAFGGMLPTAVSILFIIGVVAAAYSSADSALTALTTSFTVDILNYSHQRFDSPEAVRVRKLVHVIIAAAMVGVILIFHAISDESVIQSIFKVAGYTYGPLLGMFAFGIFTKCMAYPLAFPILAVLSPLTSYWIQNQIPHWIPGYQIGFELLIINGTITFLGLFFSHKKTSVH